MQYADFCGDDLMWVFAAASFLQAVAVKNQLQALDTGGTVVMRSFTCARQRGLNVGA